MPPCSDAVFERACLRLLRGDLWRDIEKDEGICWVEFREAGILEHNAARYRAVEDARRDYNRSEIVETGRILMQTARGELSAQEDETVDPGGGVTRKRSFQRAASTAQAAAALLAPEIHGKLAGAKAAQAAAVVPVQINITLGRHPLRDVDDPPEAVTVTTPDMLPGVPDTTTGCG